MVNCPRVTRKFGLFLVAGGTSAICNIMVRWALTPLTSFAVSVVIAYTVGVAIAYGLTSRFVFVDATASRSRSLAGFGLVNVLSGSQTLILSMMIRTALLTLALPQASAELIAHFLALASTSITSFLGHKHISFRERRHDRADAIPRPGGIQSPNSGCSWHQ